MKVQGVPDFRKATEEFRSYTQLRNAVQAVNSSERVVVATNEGDPSKGKGESQLGKQLDIKA